MAQFECIDCGKEFPRLSKLEICAGCKLRVCKDCIKRKLCDTCNLTIGQQGRNNFDAKKLLWNILKITILIIGIISIFIGVPSYLIYANSNPATSQLVGYEIVFIIIAIACIIIFRVLMFVQLWIFEDWAKKELEKQSQSELNEQRSY